MGTRGIIKVVYRNKSFSVYSQMDSYFDALGENLLKVNKYIIYLFTIFNIHIRN